MNRVVTECKTVYGGCGYIVSPYERWYPQVVPSPIRTQYDVCVGRVNSCLKSRFECPPDSILSIWQCVDRCRYLLLNDRIDVLGTGDAEDMLAFIRAAFGFDTIELANVLRVSRDAIYSWIADENYPNKLESKRLLAIREFGYRWNDMSNLPAKKFLHVPFNGVTLFDSLCDVTLDTNNINLLLKKVAECVTISNDRPNSNSILPVKNSEYEFITLNAFIPRGCR